MNDPSCRGTVRLAELVATLSLGTDLGLGQPMEHVLRQCLIALRMSERLGFSEADRRVVYYSSLLAWVGCYADAYELPDFEIGYFLSHLGAGKPILDRIWLGLTFLGEGRRAMNSMLQNHCLATIELATRLGLDDDVRESLKQSFERWDGKYAPIGLKGEEILITSRLIQLANLVEVFQRTRGTVAAIAVAKERSGSELDPTLVQHFCDIAPELFDGFDAVTTWDAVIAAEPSLAAVISDEQFESVLETIADFVDLKSPYLIGHSRAVADLAASAARISGMPEREISAIRRAGLVEDIGRLGVSNAIWDKRGPLNQSETERVHLHPYLSQRMLAFSPVLAPLGAIAVQHHERMDGSGYPRGIAGDAIAPSARILGAADSYQAMTRLRPYRPARSSDEAASILRDEAAAGRLDADAVDAVLQAAGHRVKRRREWPADLTAREVEVLRLVACGYSNREIAKELVISSKTAGNHVEHIYTKIGVSNRARASLFAMTHGLMSDAQLPEFA